MVYASSSTSKLKSLLPISAPRTRSKPGGRPVERDGILDTSVRQEVDVQQRMCTADIMVINIEEA